MKIDFDISRYGGALITCNNLGDSAPCRGQEFCYGNRYWLITGVKLQEGTPASWPPPPPSYLCTVELLIP